MTLDTPISVIVAGGRDFLNYSLLKEKLDFYLQRYNPAKITIISGAAKGADSLAIRYANQRGINCTQIYADWDTHGKKAGYVRNVEMAEQASHLIAFWDGQSRGTKMMIDIARKRALEVRVVRY